MTCVSSAKSVLSSETAQSANFDPLLAVDSLAATIWRSPITNGNRCRLDVKKSLDEALQSLEIDLPCQQREQLGHYCELLWGWNEKLNLTRHLDFETFVNRDVWDSLQLAKVLTPKERVLDVGTGGGVPGLVVGILRPDVIMTVSDSIEKKTRALEDMVQQLGLRTKVVNARVQDLLPKRKYDTLTARAVGPTKKVLRWVAPHWSRFDRLLLIKGPRWTEERSDARHLGLLNHLELRKLATYPMPGTDSESVILSFAQKGELPGEHRKW